MHGKNSRAFSLLALLAIFVGQAAAGYQPVQAPDPDTWQASATGLGATQNADLQTAGLGMIVQAKDWPFLSLRGGVEDNGSGNLAGPIGIELGAIQIPGTASATLSAESLDWSHDKLTFNSGTSAQLQLWASRLTPALLLNSSSASLRLLAGDVSGNTIANGKVTPLPSGPAYPRYAAYSSGGVIRVLALSSASTPLALDQNWLLLWYGNNSHFVETKEPLTYTGFDWYDSTLPYSAAYQADAPILLIFQNLPQNIQQSSAGGVQLNFTSASGYVSALPLFGRDHLKAADTESWAQGLPGSVLQKIHWWAGHLCAYPESARETYAYSASSDTATITENLSFLTVCAGGTTFAPVPPMLGIAKQALGVNFSASLVDAGLNTEFGPTYGVENTTSYSWSVSGLGKYIDARRVTTNLTQAPPELEQKLTSEVQKVVQAGHLAPWIFIDNLPVGDYRGDLYWANPADSLYQLSEVAAALSGPVKTSLIDYLKTERAAYPPEDVYDLDLTQGTPRQGYVYLGPKTISRWTNARSDAHLTRVPLYNFLALSCYYDLTGETLPTHTWSRAQEVLDQDMSEQDWATFYWFQGFDSGRVAVVNANRHFDGLVGYVRLAELAKDAQAEGLGRALLAKAAVLRLGMAEYPRWLYSANLVEIPTDPAWQVKETAGKWFGNLFNYHWSGPYDDARQVAQLSQFQVDLRDHSGFGDWDSGVTSAHLIAFQDMIPELARFLKDVAPADVAVYVDKVEALFPQWYAAFAEGTLGMEHNLSHPIDSFQIFLAEAYFQRATPQRLASYVDIPWLREGDLFYMQKLAEAILAYRGVIWNNTLTLWAVPGNHTANLSWEVYTALPAGTTWQIEYTGPAGTQASPITGISASSRAYQLKGLTNSANYTVKVTAMNNGAPILTSNTAVLVPADHFMYSPILRKAR